MSPKSQKRRCAHGACRAWAMHGGTLCSAHAGRVRRSRRLSQKVASAVEPGEEKREPPPQAQETLAAGPGEEVQELPTLESEIKLLAARRNKVDKALQEHLDNKDADPHEALRYLTVLAQVGRSLATMLVQRSALGGARELEDFFGAVSVRVEELLQKNGGHEPVGNVSAEVGNT